MGAEEDDGEVVEWALEVPQVGYVEEIVHSPGAVPDQVQKIVEVPQAKYVEKIVLGPKGVTVEVEKIVEVPQVEYVEKIVEVPKIEPRLEDFATEENKDEDMKDDDVENVEEVDETKLAADIANGRFAMMAIGTAELRILATDE